MKRTIIAAAVATLCLPLCAQNLTIRNGVSRGLFDGRNFNEMFADGNFYIGSLNIRAGVKDCSDTVFAPSFGYPEYGIGLGIDFLDLARYNPGTDLSNVYSLYSYLDRPFLRWKAFSFGYTVGIGLSYTYEVFDPLYNPFNYFFSTHFMCHISGGLQLRYSGMKDYDLGLGFYFNHDSNGTYRMFNHGLNRFELGLNVTQKNFVQKKAEESPLRQTARVDLRKGETEFKPHFVFDLQFSLGFAQPMPEYYIGYSFADDPAIQKAGYSARTRYCAQANLMYKYTSKHASGLGFDVFVTPYADLNWRIDQVLSGEDPYAECQYDAISTAISLRHEFLYHNLGIECYYGWFLHKNDGLYWTRTYQGLGLRYYFPGISNFYVGVLLKARSFTAADCTQYTIGKRF